MSAQQPQFHPNFNIRQRQFLFGILLLAVIGVGMIVGLVLLNQPQNLTPKANNAGTLQPVSVSCDLMCPDGQVRSTTSCSCLPDPCPQDVICAANQQVSDSCTCIPDTCRTICPAGSTLTPQCTCIPSDNTCASSGGTWRDMRNSCGDSCALITNPDLMCLQVITPGCDCGADKCWNGSSCVSNPTPIKITPKLSPVLTPVLTLAPITPRLTPKITPKYTPMITPRLTPIECEPRPSCLDSKPACLIPEPIEGWCPTHLECRNNACVRVDGEGANKCTTDASCQVTTQSTVLKFRLQGITDATAAQTVHATVKLNGQAAEQDFSATSDSQGVLTGSLQNVTDAMTSSPVTLCLKAKSHLQKCYPNVTLTTSGFVNLSTVEALAGDVNGTNTITIEDPSLVLSKYTAFVVPVTVPDPLDVNNDGRITINDIALSMLNYSDFEIAGDR